MGRLRILVDGSNIAFTTYKIVKQKKVAQFANIQLIINYLSELEKKNPEIRISFFILCDSTLRNKIDSPDKLEGFIRSGEVIQSPARTQTDDFLINYLIRNRLNTYIISNDTFQQYPKQLKKDKNSWRVPFMIFDNQILIPKLENIIERIKNNCISIHEFNAQSQNNLIEQC
ncbi:MAG: NYN domain-containing protein [Candidatus Helarchaeota archaeon]